MSMRPIEPTKRGRQSDLIAAPLQGREDLFQACLSARAPGQTVAQPVR